MVFSLLKPADWKAVLMGTMQEWKSKVKTAQSYVYGLSNKLEIIGCKINWVRGSTEK